MQKDFHYSVIKILAVKSGFLDREADLIAHASQYVDDATSHKPLMVEKVPGFVSESERYHNDTKYFDPVCTAHKGIGFVMGLTKSEMMKVYVAFHFLPNQPFTSLPKLCDKHYVTKANGQVANNLVQKAITELEQASKQIRNRKLINLGIAIHSYADTWAHQGFSGIHSPFNDIEGVEVRIGQDWEHKWYGYRPDIGHAEAHIFPDIMHLRWRYRYDVTQNVADAVTERDNVVLYAEAAEAIFSHLWKVNNQKAVDTSWIYNDLKPCFSKAVNDSTWLRAETFNAKFPNINLFYEDTWMNDALTGKSDYWFSFHLEANEQRGFVLKGV